MAFRMIGGAVTLAAAVCGGVFLSLLRAPKLPSVAASASLRVADGDSSAAAAVRLAEAGLIRSPFAFVLYAKLRGTDRRIQAGTYQLSAGMSVPQIVSRLTGGEGEIEVRIPEGASIYEIDEILSAAGALAGRGALAALSRDGIEGFLFPDTYRLLPHSPPEEIVARLRDAFDRKAKPLLSADAKRQKEQLILASILEQEVPNHDDRRVVAGILLKRIARGMPIQADATVCYAKEVAAGGTAPCLPITAEDLKMDSPYNTYVKKDLPPGPIGNPGADAIKAAGAPAASPYWYYLSDPKTGKTIFAKTLEEHAANRRAFLR